LEWGFTSDPFEVAPLPPTEDGEQLLVGRSVELRVLRNRLTSSRRIPTLDGAHGTGKTSLANVAAYICLKRYRESATGPLLLPCTQSFRLQEEKPAEQLEREVLFAVAQSLLAAKNTLADLGRPVAALEPIATWLNSPTFKSFQFSAGITALGMGAGSGSQVNDAQGFLESGFRTLLMQALTEIFPGANEGVVCVIDNLELLETSSRARKLVEQLRDPLLSVVGLRWVLCGSNGIVFGVATSSRLDGFLCDPIEIGGIEDHDAPGILDSRIRAYSADADRPGYLPLERRDFAELYKYLGRNLRRTLATTSDYCMQAWEQGLTPVTVQDKHEAFFHWLDTMSSQLLTATEARITKRAWEVFDHATQELGGNFSPSDYQIFGFNSPANLTPYVNGLRDCGLVSAVKDDLDKRRKTIQISAKGWLVYYARYWRARGGRPKSGNNNGTTG